MGVLPFITDTFDSGEPASIVMKVEDIFKANPACTVDAGTDDALAGVDVIIYNTTTATNLDGTSGGKNSSGVNNDYYSATEDGSILTDGRVTEWAKAHGFDSENGLVVAGDDFGTSTNQGYGSKNTTEGGMAPLLYCQRNYTADKNARAAWAFSQVYPELYNSANDSYCYWVNNIYHVRIGDVPKVAAYMTNQSGAVTYNVLTATAMENHFEEGYDWWNQTGQYDSTWNKYSYYNGSSRASYYSDASSEEPYNLIGIFMSN